MARIQLLIRRMALDWTLSRRQRVDFGALFYTRTDLGLVSGWELRRWESFVGFGEKTELLRCMFNKGIDGNFPREIR